MVSKVLSERFMNSIYEILVSIPSNVVGVSTKLEVQASNGNTNTSLDGADGQGITLKT